MIRAVVFRLHLSVAVAVGLVILMMAVTGVFLACEDLVMDLAERRYRVTAPEGGERLPPDALVEAAEDAGMGSGEEGSAAGARFVATSVEYRAGPRAAVRVHAGSERRVFVDPYTGEVLGGGVAGLGGFFEGLRGWHRWFNVPAGAARKGRAVTGAANLALLFLLLTGPVLWIPRRITWKSLAEGLFFRRGIRGAIRNLHWHYVIGIWSVVPLLMISATGVVMSYPSVGDRVFPVVGRLMPVEEVAGDPVTGLAAGDVVGQAEGGVVQLEAVLATAESRAPGWRSIVLNLPRPRDADVRVGVRTGRSGQPQKVGVLTVDRASGIPRSWEAFADGTPSRRAQQFLRYAHTGEYWGLAGQALAGLFTLGAAMMVWTGLSVAALMFSRWRQKRSG